MSKYFSPRFALLTVALLSPLLASAESNFSSGSGTLTASGSLDFKIVIPRVLYFAVGSGSSGSSVTPNATIDLVTFDYTLNPASVGTGVAANTITGNVVGVRVLGNGGAIGITASTLGALNNGVATETVPWTGISTVSSDATNFPAPTIPASGSGTASNIAISSGTKVTDRTANWTFSYANTAVLPAGTYGGAGTASSGLNNGRVIYTASMP